MAIADQAFQSSESRACWNKLPNQFKIKLLYLLMAQLHVNLGPVPSKCQLDIGCLVKKNIHNVKALLIAK